MSGLNRVWIPPTVLVTGASGQLGQELARLENDELRIIGKSRSELDITDAKQCRLLIAEWKPDVVIHAAAYTAVDRAETEPDRAQAINVMGTLNMAEAAEAVGAKFCYISTDYVFDGMGTKPYEVFHPTGPLSVYGRTKLEGEQAAASASTKLFVVRTSWLYGKYGKNFAGTMLQLASDRQELAVVNDQVGAPTYTYDLARFLAVLVSSDKYGTYHASNAGGCTWYDFAKAIFEEAGMSDIKVTPCSTSQFPRPAPRPAYSVLSSAALIEAGFQPLRHWRKALRDFLTNSAGGPEDTSYIFPRDP